MNKGRLEQMMARIREEYHVPCAILTVHKDGQELWSGKFGCADKEGTVPLQDNSLFWLYSMSKVYTAAMVMKLVGEGKIRLEDPVSDYLPEYADLSLRGTGEKCFNTMKIAHLLTMTGGLDYNQGTPYLEQFKKDTNGRASTREVARALAGNGLIFEPGTHFEYSLCHDVLGAVIEVVTGRSFYESLKEQLLDPLGITDLAFFPDEEQKGRIVEQYAAPEGMKPCGKENTLEFSKCHESGGAGLFSCASEYCKLLDMLANGGRTPGGEQLLSPEAIRLLQTPYQEGLAPECDADFHRKFQNHGLEGFVYSLGVRVKTGEDGTSRPGEFGWDGAAGGFALVDPHEHITITYLQSVLNHGPAYSDIHPMIRREVYQALSE